MTNASFRNRYLRIPGVSLYIVLLTLAAAIAMDPSPDPSSDPQHTQPVRVSEPECYSLPTDFTWNTWIDSALTAADQGYVNSTPLPPSELIYRGGHYIINVHPDHTDPTNTRFELTIYNVDPVQVSDQPDAGTRSSKLKKWLRKSSKKDKQPAMITYHEGPWCIQPQRPSIDAIEMVKSSFQPRWLVDIIGYGPRGYKVLHEFRVVHVGPLFLLPQLESGLRWFKGERSDLGIPPPQHKLLENHIDFAIHAMLDPTDLYYRTLSVNLYNPDFRSSYEPDAKAGPYRVRPQSSQDTASTFPAEAQPSWVLRLTDRDTPYTPLNDFRIIRKELDKGKGRIDEVKQTQYVYMGVEGGSNIPYAAIRDYESQCMTVPIVDLLTPERPASDMYMAGGVATSSDAYDPDGTGAWSVSDRISVHAQGLDRVIALSEHTDNLPFQFDRPVDGSYQPAISLLTLLYICMYSGSEDFLLRAGKSD